MKKLLTLFCLTAIFAALNAVYPDGNDLLNKIDLNMISRTSKANTTMIVQSRRATRTMVSEGWSQGSEKSYSEYLSPAREKGTKMLKDGDNLWIFDPNTDRIIQISGNMLKQSVMGSDLSYEDFMEEIKLKDAYNATVTGEKDYNGRACWVLQMLAKSPDIAYQKRQVYVDKERFLPLYEERYAKSGKLLKTTIVQDVMKVGSRWYPKQILYKDVLKEGKGTLFVINSIEFDVTIPAYIFTKASLKK
jgi:outer membrane lipoprotein-sorting protein